ncbi:MAG: peptide-methionine (R)-S-oxide reductase MsrB [Trueperaceae bacterium]|nr:peptide-methionine (R)-S-oxide reductase MsrB [Trueperaceae bacterium]
MSEPRDERTPTTEADWRARLNDDAFRVLRHEATEPPGSSPLEHELRPGLYRCAGCGQPLFRADAKFDSGSGWPSFFEPLPGALETKLDHSLAVPRREYHCSHCGGHQGHVFEDGPDPTGLRYCNNGVALAFEPADDAPG